jgi:hypothetical protein
MSNAENKDDLLKEAASALEQSQRRMEATKLAFDMVERGKIPPFSDYQSFETKIASLMGKDLRVVEEALEMDSSLADFGKVASEGKSHGNDPTSNFFHALADD